MAEKLILTWERKRAWKTPVQSILKEEQTGDPNGN